MRAVQTIRPHLAGDESPAALASDTAACIGAFDGLHLGHQALLQRARQMASRVAVVTFDPHPASVLAPQRSPDLLQTRAQRARVCAGLGVDDLVLLPFDAEIATLGADAFVRRFLGRGLQPAAIVVGEDFRFGRDRAGGVPDLRRWCAESGVRFATVGEVRSATGERISSTAIRRLVREGLVADAAEMLDRWYAIEGEVRRGAARGRGLGFPTANVATQTSSIPREGVYATVLTIVDPASDLHGRRFASVTNVGQNPTFADGARTTTGVEAHALDVDLGDALYGVRVEVGFVTRLREEIRFPDADTLVAAIHRDIELARPMLGPAVLARLPPPLYTRSGDSP